MLTPNRVATKTTSPPKISKALSVEMSALEQIYCISFFDHKEDRKPKPANLSWNEFFEKYIKVPIVRSEKDGRLFTSATFKNNLSRRKENIVFRQWLELDYDSQDLKQIIEFWKNFGVRFIFYTTHSHLRMTSEKPQALPCGRVIIELALPIPANLYNALYNWASAQTGDNADTGSKGANRALYLPAIATDDAEYDSLSVDGKPLDWTAFNLKAESAPKPSAKATRNSEVSTDDDEFILREEIGVSPPEKLNVLLENDAEFRRVWNKKRSDFRNDASRYSLSIMDFTMRAGWSPQEIVDACCEFRRNHGFTQKSQKNGNAHQWYAKELSKVRADLDAPTSETELEDDDDDDDEPETRTVETKDEKKLKAIKALRTKLKAPIKQVLKRGVSKSTYDLRLENGNLVELGTSLDIQEQRKVISKLLDAGIVFTKILAKDWQKIVGLICVHASTQVSIYDDASELRGYISQYLTRNGESYSEDFRTNSAIGDIQRFDLYYAETSLKTTAKQANDSTELLRKRYIASAKNQGMFDSKTGVVYIVVEHFVLFLNMRLGASKRWSERDMALMLERQNFIKKQKTIHFFDENEKRKSYNFGMFYTSPSGFLFDEQSGDEQSEND